VIFKEATDISSWHYLQLSEAEYLAMIAEDGSPYYAFEAKQFVRKISGSGWGKEIVLSEEIDSWLREHCGFGRLEYWGFPRVVYSEQAQPNVDGDWEKLFTPAGFNQRNWHFQPSEQRIYFRRKEYAMAFKLAFHSVEDGFIG
jgi:hypothetical protein